MTAAVAGAAGDTLFSLTGVIATGYESAGGVK
jgi:hypothetical protein